MEDLRKNFNLPNILTGLRVLSLPVFIYFLFRSELIYQVWAFVIFAIASITDLVDGYLARKWNQETELGKFLDPLADKFLVIGSFTAFLFLNNQIELWMVLVIVFRDILITFLRWLAIREGFSLRTTRMGKIKTTFQMGTILIILVIFMLISGKRRALINELYDMQGAEGLTTFEIASTNFAQFIDDWNNKPDLSLQQIMNRIASFLPYYGMLLTTIITLWSGIRYLISNFRLLRPRNIYIAFRGRHAGNRHTS
ncbi:CDP-diacylglycerol--glycerol-3-phosphate 3-phosphatidyltransferase [Leptospira sp. GIMC2001]|uniref:CDP-diacylglycerol--glycerol-3-phosphate 3-phosphatidyltransferase n=1 Tax=Leptospira sp. GIMC2001 TaxID=1513297 RepID=UPI002349F6A3|nr:CDP-diacylglycerol--glycerol-3-phosphate 3-phosphatidyltransferase [Leptospira sp. GIMC2001]WCL48394.1 CDP-diacylglycerol--glycerol-3-phosphate 3-phosphatidyltransferase [Leptospira sp. GIMC2001]